MELVAKFLVEHNQPEVVCTDFLVEEGRRMVWNELLEPRSDRLEGAHNEGWWCFIRFHGATEWGKFR